MREQYYDTVTMHGPALRCALDTLGSAQLMFGSDYPHVPGGIDRFVTVLKSVGLSDAELEIVGRRNATKLLDLEEAQTVGDR
jgi:aminocarboxymuconate-semialdehyde decarboxylase